jgi:hypothetical protein
MGGRRVEGAGCGMVGSTIEEVARRPGDGEDFDYGWWRGRCRGRSAGSWHQHDMSAQRLPACEGARCA